MFPVQTDISGRRFVVACHVDQNVCPRIAAVEGGKVLLGCTWNDFTAELPQAAFEALLEHGEELLHQAENGLPSGDPALPVVGCLSDTWVIIAHRDSVGLAMLRRDEFTVLLEDGAEAFTQSVTSGQARLIGVTPVAVAS